MSNKKAPQLPSTVRIGYRTWALGEMSKLDHTKTGNWGVSSATEGKIEIYFLGDPVEDTNTLIHEIFHCCCRVMDIEGGDEEERTVRKLAGAWTQLWRDNPDLIAYIDYTLRDK